MDDQMTTGVGQLNGIALEDDRDREIAELRAAKEAAEQLSRAKDHFLAVLSHELRTPLTPVLATISYVEEMLDIPEILRVEISSIRRNVELEARLIDDLLDATKLSRGKFTLDPEVLDIHALIRTALHVCQSDIDDKGLEVSLAFRATNRHVFADPDRMHQVFWNLIKNAVKFTPAEGRIAIRSANDELGRLTIQVVDSGVGIEPEFLPRIFDVFEQAEPSVSRRRGGLGLGLSIARMLVDLHEGELTAASDGLDRGSTFTVTLETIPSPGEPTRIEDLPSDPERRCSRILLIEDNADTLRSISRLLRLHGFEVEVATSARRAIEASTEKVFDLIISDIGLPDGSGLDVMRFARDRFGLKGIAFSGFGTDEDISASREAGFQHHITKPVRIGLLIDLIRQTIS